MAAQEGGQGEQQRRWEQSNQAAETSSVRQPAAETASSSVCFQMASVPLETRMGQELWPPSPTSQCSLPQVWDSGCCWVPSSYPSSPSTLQGPWSKEILPTQFGEG